MKLIRGVKKSFLQITQSLCKINNFTRIDGFIKDDDSDFYTLYVEVIKSPISEKFSDKNNYTEEYIPVLYTDSITMLKLNKYLDTGITD
jgi:hypothetical protein